MSEPLTCGAHPDAPAEGRCHRCGQPLCASCLKTREAVPLCRTCLTARRLRRVKILAVVSLMVGAPGAFAAWALHERLASHEKPTPGAGRASTEARNADRAQLGRVEHLMRTGRADQARVELDRILRDRPHHAGALHALARLDLETRDWDALLQHTSRLLARHPSALEARQWQAQALLALGQPDRAERTLKEGLAAVPRSGVLALALARLLAASRRRAEALDLLRDVIKRRPTSEGAALHELLLSLELTSQ